MPRGSDLVPVSGEELEVVEEVTAASVAEQIAAATEDMTRLTEEAQEIASLPVDADDAAGTALVPTTATAAQAKTRLAKLRADATRRQMQLDSKFAAIKERQREIEQLMRKQMELAQETLAPLEKFIGRLQEGIWMVNLYLGRDEEILLLRDGEPAAADEPVVIRQMVLAMDEECAVNPEDDGIDATNIGAFDKWLQADPAHVDQVAPEPRCVVALRPRFRSKQYEDPWKAQAVAEADRQTYFLIRNGDKLFRTWTDFNVGDRLVPTADEFTSFFYEKEDPWRDRGKPKQRIPIAPGTLAWERAEEAADERKRHFMRVGLILQGLVDRTTVFHPLPDSGVNFLDYNHSGRSWRFALDAEMTIGTGRKPFYEWLAEKNEELRVGMRIVGAFGSSQFRDQEYDNGYRNERLRPPTAKRPSSNVLHVIEEQDGDAFIIRYERNEEIYDSKVWVESETRPGWGHRGAYVKPKRRASCRIFRSDEFILPFDLVTEEEMTAYLGARLDRHAYATMFPLLKAAIRAKRAEREQEAPFRQMLVGVLARENGAAVEDADADVDELIRWFKLTNKNHRPLVGDEQSQAKAVRMIVAEHARRGHAKKADPVAVAAIQRQHPDALLIGRKRDGKYVALVPEDDGNVFVSVRLFPARLVGAAAVPSGEPQRWRLMPPLAQRVRWHVAYTSERFDGWDFNASTADHVTGPEFDAMVETVMAERGENALAVGYDREKHEFHTWRLVRGALIDAEHPLSGEHSAPEVTHVERQWVRAGGGEARLRKESRSWRSEYADQRKPWDTRSPAREKETRYSSPRKTNRYELLFEDEALEAEWASERRRFEEFEARRDELNGIVRGYIDGLVKQWVEKKEAEVYARFLEDFLDPELWEGHRKTLPRGTFDYPRHHRLNDTDALVLLVTHAVETGRDLAGLTVWQAAEEFPGIEWLRRATGGDDVSSLPEAIDIPEDLRGLVFREPPRDDDDEEVNDDDEDDAED